MRMLDVERKQSLRTLQLYLTPDEARVMRDRLNDLLANPEANEHFHVPLDGSGRELSCSIVTARKLKEGHYTALERSIFEEQ